MTVVEAHACGEKIDPPENKSLLPPRIISFLIEGIAQNTTGSVFVPEVGYIRLLGIAGHCLCFLNYIVVKYLIKVQYTEKFKA